MRTFVYTDLHGNYNLFKQIQNYLGDNDRAICLGDNCDRGPDGIKIIQETLKDSRITYLQGNHEAMLVDAIRKSQYNGNISFKMFDDEDMEILKHNGMTSTLQALQLLPQEEREHLIEKLDKLPVSVFTVGKDGCTVFLSHAGCHPTQLNELDRDETLSKLIWDREHIAEEVFHCVENNKLYIVHGHTPVQTLGFYNRQLKNYNKAEIVYYCEGHKIDLDICTPETNKVALFDLSTFEVIYFVDDTKLN
jgi:serine/threonine protein phosphatase 1